MQNNKDKALTAAALRGVVTAYLVFLGYKIITNQDTTMSVQTARLLGGGLIAAAAAFAVYIVLRLRADLKSKPQGQEDDDDRTE